MTRKFAMTLRFNPTNRELSYDPTACFIPQTGIDKADLAALAPKLEAARAETLADLELWHSGGPVPADKQPLDAGFMDLPDRLLADYKTNRHTSELGRILATAARLREAIDRVVVLGIGGSYMGARALLEACCHPYHNELSRGERGGKPRIYFEGNNVDNDSLQGLLDLLGCNRATPAVATAVEDRWGIVVISKSGGTLETAAAFRLFWNALQKSLGGERSALAEYIVPVTGKSGRLFELSRALGCPEIFDIPDGVGGRFSILTAVGLLPAAVIGIDIVRLLEGAAAMNARYRTAGAFSNRTPLGSNPVLDYVGVCHLLEVQRGATIRILSTWGKGLEAAGMWYDQLLSESLGKKEHGATPLTVVNTRDLHSRGQQHQEGRRDKVITNVISHSVRRDRLAIEASDLDQDKLNELAGKTVPQILTAAIDGTNQAYADDCRPTADLNLPGLDEYSMGQFFQMLMLATVLEGRLIGINPYGQPGVEGYKKHMQKNLRG
ncbi:MAG: glucose-6-phosphate isomerase [Pirellulales bacterium]|nr:glucose-6-phosphate isomerase [Pirellulales bacterium]